MWPVATCFSLSGLKQIFASDEPVITCNNSRKAKDEKYAEKTENHFAFQLSVEYFEVHCVLSQSDVTLRKNLG